MDDDERCFINLKWKDKARAPKWSRDDEEWIEVSEGHSTQKSVSNLKAIFKDCLDKSQI